MDNIAIKEPVEVVETNNRGRPCKYETHVQPRLDEILEWCKQGYNEYSICEQLDISRDAWIDYKKNYIQLTDIIARARTERNCLVMNSMFKKATGEKAQIKKAKVLNDGSVIPYTEEQYIPPDVNAADLYLRNNSEDYKSAKADGGSLTLIQNNFQLPQLEQKLQQIADKRKQLEALVAVDYEVVEDK